VLPLLGRLNITFGFYVLAGFGNPVQHLPLLVDTGAAELIVLTTECTTCDPRALKYSLSASAQLISCSDSTVECHDCQNVHGSRACTFDVTYSDGSEFAGYLAVDNFTVGNFTARVQFGGVVVENAIAQSIEGSLDIFSGIWGLGFREQSAWRGETSFDFLVAQTGIPDAFSMCLNDVNPTMVIGVDPRDTPGVEFTTLTSSSDFAITLNDITVGGSSLGISSSVLSQPFCSVSTGSPLVFLVQPAYDAFVNALQNMCFTTNLVGVCGTINDSLFDNFCWKMTPNDLAAFPNITFSVENIATPLTLTPQDYLFLLTGFRCLGIASSPVGTTLGVIFMQAFNVVFDRGGLHIGFAPLSSCATNITVTTTGRNITSTTGPKITTGPTSTTGPKITTGPTSTTGPKITTGPRSTTGSSTTGPRSTTGSVQSTTTGPTVTTTGRRITG